MKKLFLLLLSAFSYGQFVNETDLNSEVSTFEVWAVAKPFSTQESYFVDYGQDGFKPVNYDHKKQALFNDDKKKFEKGEWIKILNYLESKGWEVTSERPASIGNQQGRIIQFKKK